MSVHFIPKEKIVRHCKKIPVHPKKPANAAILTRASALDRLSSETLSTSARTSQKLLGCEGGNDLFEAWIAAQGVPKRQQFQLPVAEKAWVTGRDRKLCAGQIFVANPRSDNRELLD